MLIVCAIPGSKPDLRQRIIKTRLFGDLRQFTVVGSIPVGSLLYLTDHQSA